MKIYSRSLFAPEFIAGHNFLKKLLITLLTLHFFTTIDVVFWPIKLPLSWAGKKWVLPTGVDLLVTFPDALPHGKLVRVKNIRLGSLRSLVYLKRFFQARGPPLNFTFGSIECEERGQGVQTSRLPYLAYPASSPSFLSFFPLAIFDCEILSIVQ